MSEIERNCSTCAYSSADRVNYLVCRCCDPVTNNCWEPKEKPERSCFNCKHGEIGIDECGECNSYDLTNWEPKEEKEMAEVQEKKSAEELKEKIKELQATVKRLEKYKHYDEAAEELKAIYDALIHAGFSDDQAFALMNTMIAAAGKNVNF